MSEHQRWQVVSHPKPGIVQSEASGLWPDTSSLEDLDE
jgi:hypothetical protein